VSLKAPRTVWSVWVVLDNGQNNRVGFDDIRMSLSGDPSTVKHKVEEPGFRVYPNPFKGRELHLLNPDGLNGPVKLFDMKGRELRGFKLSGQRKFTLRFQEPLKPGIYLLRVPGSGDPACLKIQVHH